MDFNFTNPFTYPWTSNNPYMPNGAPNPNFINPVSTQQHPGIVPGFNNDLSNLYSGGRFPGFGVGPFGQNWNYGYNINRFPRFSGAENQLGPSQVNNIVPLENSTVPTTTTGQVNCVAGNVPVSNASQVIVPPPITTISSSNTSKASVSDTVTIDANDQKGIKCDITNELAIKALLSNPNILQNAISQLTSQNTNDVQNKESSSTTVFKVKPDDEDDSFKNQVSHQNQLDNTADMSILADNFQQTVT